MISTAPTTLARSRLVNFWYAGCAPCRVEAKDLESVWQEYGGEDVAFIGINTRDQADTAQAFSDEFGITYPSLIDVNTACLLYTSPSPRD